MTMLNLQKFIVAYIRDMSLREECAAAREEVLARFELTPEEMELIRNEDFGLLDVTAKNMYLERYQYRSQQFMNFSRVLEMCDLLSDYMEGFVRAYPGGGLGRKEEGERMLEFGQSFLKERRLPEVLKDLLFYSYYINTFSFHQAEDEHNVGELDWDAKLSLKRPYTVMDVRYDVLQLVDNPNITSVEDVGNIPQRSYKLFLQKNYQNLLSCHAFELDDNEFFSMLEENLTGREILERASTPERKRELEELIRDLYDQEVIGQIR